MIRCSSEPQGLRLFTPRSTGREDKKIFPRSKVKTAYSSLLRCFVLLESDLSFLLTQFARGLHLVARRWRATAHSRAHDPTEGVAEFVRGEKQFSCSASVRRMTAQYTTTALTHNSGITRTSSTI